MKLERVIETCLYVDDLDRAASFYEQVLGLTALTSDARFRAYDVGGQSVLLLFRRGATLETVRMPGGTIEGRTDWSRSGHSIYFRDPDGHLLELATPGLWATY